MNLRGALMMSLLAALVTHGDTAWAGKVSGKISAQELERVMAGEVVRRRVVDEETKSGAGYAYALFQCKQETFWEVVYDYPGYARMFPPITSAKVVSGTTASPRFLTEIEMKFTLATITYTTYNLRGADGLRLDYGLQKEYPHSYIRDIVGYWQLEPLGPDSFLAEYKAAVELDVSSTLRTLIMPIYHALTGRDLPKMMETYRREVARRGG